LRPCGTNVIDIQLYREKRGAAKCFLAALPRNPRINYREQLCRRRIAKDLEEEEERCGNDDAVVIHARNNPDEEVTL
jgi:hypothetical protein